jgi:hypothetical protein
MGGNCFSHQARCPMAGCDSGGFVAGTKMNFLSNLLRPLANGLGTLYPSCKEATRLQSAAFDRRLPLLRRLGLKFHLLLCKWCRRYGKQITFLRSAAQESAEHDHFCPPQTLSADARERIKRRLQSEAK